MGRPLSKQQLFGANANNNIKVQFHNGTESVRGYILKQTGTKRYKCIDENGNEAVCYLVDKASADLAEGEMSVTFIYDDDTVQQAVKITRHRVSLVYDAVLQSFPWNFSTSTTDGAWQIEEAGSSSAMTDGTNLEGDEGPTIPAGMDPDEPLAGSGGSNNTVPGTFVGASSYIDAYDATGITFRDITASGLASVTNTTSGLIRQKYVGNFSEDYIDEVGFGSGLDMNFFVPANGPISTDALEVDTYTGFGLRTDLDAENNYAFEWKGYIQAKVTGNMRFFATVDDDVVVWIGAPALSPTNSNYLLAQSGNARDGDDGVTVEANKWYPVRIWFQEWAGAEKMQLGANNSVNSTLYGLGTGATQFTVAHNSATRGYNP
jgi:hypothetical protein